MALTGPGTHGPRLWPSNKPDLTVVPDLTWPRRGTRRPGTRSPPRQCARGSGRATLPTIQGGPGNSDSESDLKGVSSNELHWQLNSSLPGLPLSASDSEALPLPASDSAAFFYLP